jgi:predicted ArsR family transcriptional regulator
MSEDRRGAKVGAQIMRELKQRPNMTVDDVCVYVELNDKAARSWLKALQAEGIVKGKLGPKRSVHGCAPVEYRIATEWGGL